MQSITPFLSLGCDMYYNHKQVLKMKADNILTLRRDYLSLPPAEDTQPTSRFQQLLQLLDLFLPHILIK